MSLLQQEIEDVVKTIVVPDPIFELNVRSTSISVRSVDRTSSNSDSILKEAVLASVGVIWHKQNKCFVLKHANCKLAIRQSIANELISYVRYNSSSRNPRLTGLYQWYNQVINDSVYDRYAGLEDLLFSTWKYIKSNPAHKENAMNILEVVKQKFEAKGLKK